MLVLSAVAALSTECARAAPSSVAPAPDDALSEASEPLRPIPERVALDPRRVALGERLFRDPRLSGDGTVACVHCHPLDQGGSDGRAHSVGARGRVTAVNTPTVFNVGFNFRYNWDGAYDTLEAELDAPVLRAMGTDWRSLVGRLRAVDAYRNAFAAAYANGLTEANVRNALATYERSLTTPGARFDRHRRKLRRQVPLTPHFSAVR